MINIKSNTMTSDITNSKDNTNTINNSIIALSMENIDLDTVWYTEYLGGVPMIYWPYSHFISRRIYGKIDPYWMIDWKNINIGNTC